MAGPRNELDADLLRVSGPGGGELLAATDLVIARWAKTRGLSLRRAMIACLEDGVWPERFRAGAGTVDAGAQIRLLQSGAAVIGCGGLGGWCSLQLARWGVGRLHLCDADVFEQSNFNRQALAALDTVGRNKAEVAAGAVGRINPATKAKAFVQWADAETLPAILEGCDVALDCLDNHKSRYDLETAARKMDIPYIHGAIAGMEGMVMVVHPGGPGLRDIYGQTPPEKAKSAETDLGVPTSTPALVASLQVMEAVKLLAGWPAMPSGRMLHVDLAGPELEYFQVG